MEAVELDVTSAPFKADPWLVCAHLRAEAPVVRLTLPSRANATGRARHAYLVTRYEDAAALLRDERFVKNVRSARELPDRPLPWLLRSLQPLASNMLDTDGDQHRRLRGLVRHTFAPRYTAGLESRVQAIADELLDRMAAAGRADLIADYALRLPLTVIAEILGVPERDRLRLRRWLTWLFATDSRLRRHRVGLLLGVPAAIGMMRYLRRLIADRRTQPRDDLVSMLAAENQGGDRLTEDELVAMVALLLIAGYETTVNLIATGTLLLLGHPDQLALLRADPALIEPAVEELLRLATPIDVATERYAAEDVEIAGVTIPRGSLVLAGVVAANADQTRFPDPERLDLCRADNRHLSFGLGPHYCLGAPLARLEGRIAIGSLVRRFPDLRLDVPVERLRWKPGMSLRGLRSLPVRFSSPPG